MRAPSWLLILSLALPFAACTAARTGGLAPAALRPEAAARPAPGLVAAPPQEALLPRGGWEASVLARIEATIRAHGRPDLPLDRRPVAALALDGTCLRHGLGLATFLEAVDRRALVLDESFLAAVPEDAGRAALRATVERAAALPADAPPDVLVEQTPFLALRKALYGVYAALRGGADPGAAPAWLTRALAGLRPADVRALAEGALRRGLAAPLDERRLVLSPYDEEPLLAPSGLRYHDELRTLVAALQRHGFDVWIVAETNQWTAEVGAQPLGIAPHHVIGARLAHDADGRLLPELLEPAPWGAGKVDAVRTFVGRPPTLVVGHGPADHELLRAAAALAVVVEPDAATRALAGDEGWAVQPRLPTNP